MNREARVVALYKLAIRVDPQPVYRPDPDAKIDPGFSGPVLQPGDKLPVWMEDRLPLQTWNVLQQPHDKIEEFIEEDRGEHVFNFEPLLDQGSMLWNYTPNLYTDSNERQV